MSAFDIQVGGDHYRRFEIQPSEFIQRNGVCWLAGNAIKYLCRFPHKGKPLEDLAKAKHYIELLIEMERAKAPHTCPRCSTVRPPEAEWSVIRVDGRTIAEWHCPGCDRWAQVPES